LYLSGGLKTLLLALEKDVKEEAKTLLASSAEESLVVLKKRVIDLWGDTIVKEELSPPFTYCLHPTFV
jgi:hypothetical protein